MSGFFEKVFPSSPRRLIFLVTLAVFLSESISMAIIFALNSVSLSNFAETLLDSTLLVVLLSPILYFFVFMPMLRNIAERRKAEESLRQLNRKLQSTASELALAYRDLEGFSHSVSHDLRAPMRIIGGLSNILLEDYYDALDDKGKKLLGSIRGQTERLDKLVMALLDLSKAERREMRMGRIDMAKEAGLIAAELTAAATGRKIEMTVDDLTPAYGDATLIRQVLTNLLSNAVKFTKNREIALITVGSECDGGEDRYYVKDNGAGFDMSYGDKLFGIFQRVHGEKEFEGIGIGLSIVERIVRRHGGRVWAEGKPDEGATFHFALPKREGRPAENDDGSFLSGSSPLSAEARSSASR